MDNRQASLTWWNSLSINECKALAKNYRGGVFYHSQINECPSMIVDLFNSTASASVYESEDNLGFWGFINCECDSYETQQDALQAAKEYLVNY